VAAASASRYTRGGARSTNVHSGADGQWRHVVLGGEIARTRDILLAAIRETVYRHAAPLVTRDLQIIRAQMGRSSGLVDAGLLAVDALLAADRLGAWITAGTPLRQAEVADLLARVASAGAW
jgi:hypothetical protein